MSKLKLFHTSDELKNYHGSSILFITRNDWHFREASLSVRGYDSEKREPVFEYEGLEISTRQIWLWCERSDLFNKTNLGDLTEEEK